MINFGRNSNYSNQFINVPFKQGSFVLFNSQSLIVTSSVTQSDATLFVDWSIGDDSTTYANNSITSPWKTLGRAVWGHATRSSANADEAAKPGDIVSVAPGTYHTTYGTDSRLIPIYNSTNEGEEGNLITYRASGNVLLTATTTGDGEPIIGVGNKDYIKWDGFVLSQSLMHFRIDSGIAILIETTGSELHNLKISGSYYYDGVASNNHSAIRLSYAHKFKVYNCRLYGFIGGNDENDSGITAYHVSSGSIENNEIYDCDSGIYFKVPNWASVFIRYNKIHDCDSGLRLLSFQVSSSAYQNVIWNCAEGIHLQGFTHATQDQSFLKTTIQNNTVVSCSYAGLHLGGEWGEAIGADDTFVYNNIFANCGTFGIDAIDQTVAESAEMFAQLYSDYNLYVGYGNFATLFYENYTLGVWQVSSSLNELHTITGSQPQFVNAGGLDFRLTLAGSPASASGFDSLNLSGRGISSSINMGAYISADQSETIGIIE